MGVSSYICVRLQTIICSRFPGLMLLPLVRTGRDRGLQEYYEPMISGVLHEYIIPTIVDLLHPQRDNYRAENSQTAWL